MTDQGGQQSHPPPPARIVPPPSGAGPQRSGRRPGTLWVIAIAGGLLLLALATAPAILRSAFFPLGPTYGLLPGERLFGPPWYARPGVVENLFGFGLLLVLGLGLLALLVGLVWLLTRSRPHPVAGNGALEILRQRHARGEIDQRQYEAMRGVLTRS